MGSDHLLLEIKIVIEGKKRRGQEKEEQKKSNKENERETSVG